MRRAKEQQELFRQMVIELSGEMRILTNMIEGDDFPGWKERLEAQSKLCDLLRAKLLAMRKGEVRHG